MRDDKGFTVLESLIALMIVGIGLAIIVPGFVVARDHALLDVSIWQIVSDLRTQQMTAEKKQYYQEIRFPLIGNVYYLYDSTTHSYAGRLIEPPIAYFEGILHLPQTTVRFAPSGNVNESGQVIMKDPEGLIRNAVLYMQYGDIRVATYPIVN